MEHAVNKLKNGKAAGSDEIVAEMVKNGGQAMIDWLWELPCERSRKGTVFHTP